MELKAFLLSMPMSDRESFAVRCGTTYGHLRNVAYGKPCAEKLAINIDRESGGVVTCESLCPDVDFHYLRGRAAQVEEGATLPPSSPRPQPQFGLGANSAQQIAGSESIAGPVAIVAQGAVGARETAAGKCGPDEVSPCV